MSQAYPDNEVPSPCIGVCKIGDPGFCVGCGRLITEIAGWRAAGVAEKHAILARAEQRMRETPDSGRDADLRRA